MDKSDIISKRPGPFTVFTYAEMDYAKLMEPFMLNGVTPTGEEIGTGAYGKVFKVKYCGVNYAAKEVHPILVQACDSSSVQRMRRIILRQTHLPSTCPHPNIVRFIGMYHIPSNKGVPTLVMELMDYNLTKFVERDGPIPLHSALSILHDVSLGLWYLHSRNPPVIHYELTPNNIFVKTHPLVAKIAGLGKVAPEDFTPNLYDDDVMPGRMTVFKPPEVLGYENLKNYNMLCDIFSYGAVALYTVVGEWPVLSDPVILDPKTRKLKALSEVERRQQYLDKMIGEAEVLRRLVEECLDNRSARRPTIATVSERINQAKTIYMDYHPETKVTSVHTLEL